MLTVLMFFFGFALGAAVTVALLFILIRPSACAGAAARDMPAGISTGKRKPDVGLDTDGGEGALTYEKQLENLMSYDGKPQKTEEVNENGD